MKIKFLCDYIGRETAMKQYHEGDVAEFDHQAAIEIIRLGGGKEVPNPRVEAMLQEFTDAMDDLLQPAPKKKKVKYEPNES